MTDEIIKLYENAGIKPYIYCSKPQLDCDARETGNCKQDCEYYSGKRTTTTRKIKRSECPYGGIDCAWCTVECE